MNIVLVEPEIPPNTGNVARLCAATKTVLHLVEPFGFKLDDAQLQRAGMDYWQHVQWHRWPEWTAFDRQKVPTARGFGSSSPAGRRFTATRNFQRAIIWYSGARPPGCRSVARAEPRAMARIPMFNEKSRSLNLSNCVALVLFEALRQQGFKNEMR